MNKSFYLAATILATVFLLPGCAIHVQTRVDRQADFSRYKTFCWMEGCEFKISGPSHLIQDSILRENVKKSIINELKNRGIFQDDNNPDLLIAFTITIKDEESIVYRHSDENPFYYKMDMEPKVYRYLKGSMVIAMADKKESKIVWESLSESYFELNPDMSEKNIAKGIRLALKNFPPKN